MSLTFTKLFSSITESTIWCEDSETRIVWITMLAMADKHGRVWGSIPGVANRARVSCASAEAAINKFLSPDTYSRSNTYDPSSEGRRLEIIEGGWRLINHAHYRAIRDEEERRAYKAEHERARRAKLRGQNGQKWTGVDSGGHNAEAEADADADADAEADKGKTSRKNPVHQPDTLKGKTKPRAGLTEGFNPSEIAVALCQQNGWAGPRMVEALMTAIQFKSTEMPKYSLEQVGEWLVKAFWDHKAAKGDFAGNPLTFFQQAKYPHSERKLSGVTSLPANDPAAYARAAMEGD